MFAHTYIKGIVVFGLLFVLPAAAFSQAFYVPKVSDPVIASYFSEAAKDYAVVRANVASTFTAPANAAPLPCEVPRLTLIKIVGAVGLQDETPEVRKAYLRSMRKLNPEYVKSEYHIEDLQVQAIKAQCKNGKLDGDIELWVTGSRIANYSDTVHTQKFQKRVSFNADNGTPSGRIRTWGRGGNVVKWLDPETAAMMTNASMPKLVDAWWLEYKTLDTQAPSLYFNYVELSNPRNVSEISSAQTPLPNGGYEQTRYQHQQLASTMQYKNGEAHGLMVVYPTPDGFVKEKFVKCYRNGEEYQASPCDVD
jgi:hypothetical protein